MLNSKIDNQTVPRYRTTIGRHGFAMTDLLVGATLLVALISFVAPLVIRTGRLWQDTDRTRLALDELTNQLETITQLDETKLPAALRAITPSPLTTKRLPNASIDGEILTGTDGTRVVLSLHWDRVGPTKPVTLVAWIDSLPADIDLDEDTPNEYKPVEDSSNEGAEETPL